MLAIRLFIAALIAASVVACTSGGDDGPPAPSYTATRLTVIESAGMITQGMNDNGDIVGTIVFGDGAVVYSKGTIKSLGTLPGYNSGGISINNLGQVVGYLSSSLKGSAFLYTAGAMVELGGMNGAVGINNRGEVAGVVVTPDHRRTVLYSGGTYVEVASGTDSDPTSLNDKGEIVGSYYPLSGYSHPFMYSNGKFTTLDFRGAAYHINSKGDFVGTTIDDPSNPQLTRAFLYSGSKLSYIENPDGCCISARRIDEAGRIYGRRLVQRLDAGTAYVLSDGKIYDLRSRVVSGMAPEEVLLSVQDVNTRGQVLAIGCQSPCAASRVYLLDPT